MGEIITKIPARKYKKVLRCLRTGFDVFLLIERPTEINTAPKIILTGCSKDQKRKLSFFMAAPKSCMAIFTTGLKK